jgi:hypothetical protein
VARKLYLRPCAKYKPLIHQPETQALSYMRDASVWPQYRERILPSRTAHNGSISSALSYQTTLQRAVPLALDHSAEEGSGSDAIPRDEATFFRVPQELVSIVVAIVLYKKWPDTGTTPRPSVPGLGKPVGRKHAVPWTHPHASGLLTKGLFQATCVTTTFRFEEGRRWCFPVISTASSRAFHGHEFLDPATSTTNLGTHADASR